MGVKVAATALFVALVIVTAVGWIGAGGGVDASTLRPAKRINLKYEFLAGFRPREITIVEGTKITWVNKDRLDGVKHTVTKQDGVSLFFDSKSIAPGETFERIFHTAGRIRYVCSYHDHMRGTIIVTEAP